MVNYDVILLLLLIKTKLSQDGGVNSYLSKSCSFNYKGYKISETINYVKKRKKKQF